MEQLAASITKAGGTVITEEAPARFDLAYDIIKYLEGRNRKFNSAYFGWVRFTAEPAAIEGIDELVGGNKELLRHLLIKLTKAEEANPFLFHEALEEKKVETVDVSEAAEVKEEAEEVSEATEKDEAETVVTEDGEESVDKV